MSAVLSPVDLAWLRMDEPTNPMGVTAVLRLPEAPDPVRLARRLRERVLDRYPRFRRFPRRHHLRTHWEDWPGDVLAACLRVVDDGGALGLEAAVARTLGTPLPHDRPLWTLELRRGRDGAALLAHLHHAIGDGFALARVLLSLSDEGDAALGPPPPRTAGPHPAQLRDLPASVRHLLTAPAEPPNRLRRPLGNTKRAAWQRAGRAEALRARARGLGGTLNDLYLASLAGALRAELGEEAARVGALRAFVPVNLRPLDEPVPAELGNRFGLVYLPLPMGLASLEERVAVVHAESERLKHTPEAVAAFGILETMGLAPAVVEALAVDVLSAKGSAVVTNVPGPPARLHLDGVPVEEILFWVPQAARVGVGVSLFSYAGEVSVGVATDAGILPAPDRLLRTLLRELAGG